MNADQFKQWLTHHATCFPTMRNRFASNPEAMANWRDRLRLVSFDTAKNVTDAMSVGAMEHPTDWEWDRLPIIILREHYDEQRAAALQRKRQEHGYDGAFAKVTEEDAVMRDAYRYMMRLIAEGATKQEAGDAMRKKFFPTVTQEELFER